MSVKEQRNGKNIIFIKEQTEAELINTIKKLPADFMVRSSFPVIGPESKPASAARIDSEFIEMLQGLTTEELEELIVYIKELISHR